MCQDSLKRHSATVHGRRGKGKPNKQASWRALLRGPPRARSSAIHRSMLAWCRKPRAKHPRLPYNPVGRSWYSHHSGISPHVDVTRRPDENSRVRGRLLLSRVYQVRPHFMAPEFLTIMTAETSAKVFLAVRNRRPCLSSPQQRRDCRRGSHPQQQRLLRRGSACARRWGNAGVGALQKALTHFCSTVQAHPDDADSHDYVGEILLEPGQYCTVDCCRLPSKVMSERGILWLPIPDDIS